MGPSKTVPTHPPTSFPRDSTVEPGGGPGPWCLSVVEEEDEEDVSSLGSRGDDEGRSNGSTPFANSLNRSAGVGHSKGTTLSTWWRFFTQSVVVRVLVLQPVPPRSG